MKALHPILLFVLVTLFGQGSAVRAAHKDVSSEPFGKLVLGQRSDALVKLLGDPGSKGKDTLWEAIGEWVQDWNYPASGLKLGMASAKKNGAKTLLSITATKACTLATARGIKIGSAEAAVRKAYAKEEDKDASHAGKAFVAGSVYGGVIFTFKDGKVTEIFIGAAAE